MKRSSSFLFLSLFWLTISTTASFIHAADQQNLIKDRQQGESINFADLRAIKKPLAFILGDVNGKAQFKWRPETFFARNIYMLNNSNLADQIYRSQSTLDLSFQLEYGKKTFQHAAHEMFLTVRNKGVWGSPENIISTTDSAIKFIDFVGLNHRHGITRLAFWFREIWFKFSINDAFGLSFEKKHSFTLGAFPFELGRGIALGSAYGKTPASIAFYTDNSIDQYAFGFKFNGDITCKATYDLYGAILNNQADDFSKTTEKIYTQEYDRAKYPQRGAGKVNYLIAGRIRWAPLATPCASVLFEPYFLYNDIPEQRVDFPSDSSSKLGTFGCAGEFMYGEFEWGYDTAVNVGRQKVSGWDRNQVDMQNINGVPTFVNSRVVTDNPVTNPRASRAIFIPDSAGQKAITTAPQSASQNGKLIYTAPDGLTQYYNGLERFRDPYFNELQGWMFVIDAGHWLYKRDLKLTAMVGVASGDENPNKNLNDPNDSRVDGNYKGFLGLQEIYTGSRVQSVFFLGGAGRIPRPGSSALSNVPVGNTGRGSRILDATPANVNGFTNLIMVGSGLQYKPEGAKRPLSIRPNAIFYWQQFPTKRFDLIKKASSTENASRYLGFEGNMFTEYEPMPDFKLYAVGSFFVPGSHYRDIKGKPLTSEQQKFLDRLDVSGIDLDLSPLISNNTGYTVNIGIEIRY